LWLFNISGARKPRYGVDISGYRGANERWRGSQFSHRTVPRSLALDWRQGGAHSGFDGGCRHVFGSSTDRGDGPHREHQSCQDSTLAILLAAQAEDWEIHYAELGDLSLRDGVAWGRLAPLEVMDDKKAWFARGAHVPARLGDYDVILMRKDPPFDMEYIYSTYILDRAGEQGALVCNDPRGLRDMNEKVYTAWFPECCAPTLITRDMHDMSEFLKEHGKAVCKRCTGWVDDRYSCSSKATRIATSSRDPHGLRAQLRHRAALPAADRHGRRHRVILINGEPVPFALQRMPDAADHRGEPAAARQRRAARSRARPLAVLDHRSETQGRWHGVRRIGCDRGFRH